MQNKNKEDENDKNEKTKGFWIIVSLAFLVISVILAWVIYAFFMQDKIKAITPLEILSRNLMKEKPAADQADGNIRRAIDGVYAAKGQENYFPIAVVIDNHLDARPQSGLASANLVFEAEVEGATTRFLAFFADNRQIENIGPVRSARPYFIDWISEFSSSFVHCGGSPEALTRIIKENVININEFYKGELFWRSNSHLAPHNVYTSIENIRAYLNDKNLIAGKYFSWLFKDDEPSEEATSNHILIPEFGVVWKYNKLDNSYIRYLGKSKHLDASSQEIKAKNIIIMAVNSEVIDEELRLKLETIGSGEAVVCSDGNCEEGQWRKKSKLSRTRYYDQAGAEIVFNAGTTWVEVVRPGYKIDY
ncbi:MAG: DUF3048 domain-containing protein [Patescibacteria group bacterium]|nr:DUF3048 domain-containing protein [Patescibacteria group bacterium]